MAGRPQIGAPGHGQKRRRAVTEEVGAGGPEAHHRDVGAVARHASAADRAGRCRRDAASFADAFNTSDVAGVNGVKTDACTGTQTPYRGSTLTVDRRSATVMALWVALDPACCTACATAASAFAYGVGVRFVSCTRR